MRALRKWSSSTPGLPLVRAILAAALAAHAAAAVAYAVSSPQPAGDFDRYYAIATGAGRPYVDYQVEHPIATLALFKSIARLPGGRSSFGVAIVALNAVADGVIVWSLWQGWGVTAAAVYAVSVLPVIDLLFNRIDAWSTAAAIVAIAAWRRKRPIASGVSLAIGAAFKLWPLVLTPVLLVPWRGTRSRRSIAAVVITSGALGAAAFSVAGIASVREVLTFRGATGWQVESTVGSLVNLFGSEAPRLENNAFRIGELSAPTAVGLFAAALPFCLWLVGRGARAGCVGTGWLAAVPALLLSSALFSAQYVIWLTPAAGAALCEGDLPGPVLVLAATALTQAFMRVYGAVVDPAHASLFDTRSAARALVVVRNLVVLAIAAHSIVRLGPSHDRMPEEEPCRKQRLSRRKRAEDLRLP